MLWGLRSSGFVVDRHLKKAMKALMGGVQAQEGEVDEDNIEEMVRSLSSSVMPSLMVILGRESPRRT